MIKLMRYTYLLKNDKIKEELENLWKKYLRILDNLKSSFEDINEARAILYLTGDLYCEKIAVEAIQRRIHLLKKPIQLNEFFHLIDSNSERLEEMRNDELFRKLEEFYRIIKEYKNKYSEGKFYLDEDKFLELYDKLNPEKDLKSGYKGGFGERSLGFMR